KIFLLGDKIKGAYALVRTSDPGEREQWLLIKKKGEGADARRRPTSSQPESVLSGKTIEQLRKEEG
ncbi:MAG: DNA polymerase ligase N-terminal domain-containing protein, partial [Solirubrobacterales bacterium]